MISFSFLRAGVIAGAALLSVSSAQATTLNVALNVDNAFTAYVSTDDSVEGTAFLSGDDWPTTYSAGTSLSAGMTNYLHIRADDLGDPAMLLGLFTLSDADFSFANGTQRMVSGESGLMVSDTGWGASSATADLGANGTGPWGALGTAADARFVWSSNLAANTTYFTAAISYDGAPVDVPPISAVPLPAGMPLLLAGLAGLGFLRRLKRA